MKAKCTYASRYWTKSSEVDRWINLIARVMQAQANPHTLALGWTLILAAVTFHVRFSRDIESSSRTLFRDITEFAKFDRNYPFFFFFFLETIEMFRYYSEMRKQQSLKWYNKRYLWSHKSIRFITRKSSRPNEIIFFF